MAKNNTSHALRTGLLGLMLALMLMSVLALSASAQAPSQSSTVATPQAHGLTSHIKLVKGKANYVPNSVSCKSTQPLTIANDTNVAQTVTAKGNPVVTIQPHHSVTKNCGGKPGMSFTLGLQSNPKAMLTVHIK